MGVKGEVNLGGDGTTVTPGKAYVIYHSSILNPNGIVRICPIGATTISAMCTALGYPGGTAAVANLAERATGAFTGRTDSGGSFID
jgi:hypothetical protein